MTEIVIVALGVTSVVAAAFIGIVLVVLGFHRAGDSFIRVLDARWEYALPTLWWILLAFGGAGFAAAVVTYALSVWAG